MKKHDHNIDPKSVEHFTKFLGYSQAEFWSIIDNLYNREIFEKNVFGEWVLKNPV